MTGLPVSTVYIHHTVTMPSPDPAVDMRNIEAIDIARFGVPSYSWVIHPSGVVLDGMTVHRGAHTINNANQSQNDISFGVSFIGNFENDQPTDAALHACGDLLRSLEQRQLVRDGWVLKGHRDVYATACPGAHLYPRLGDIRALVDQPPVPEEDIVKATYVKSKTGSAVSLLLGDGSHVTVDPSKGMGFLNIEEIYAKTLGVEIVAYPNTVKIWDGTNNSDGTKVERPVWILTDDQVASLGLPY